MAAIGSAQVFPESDFLRGDEAETKPKAERTACFCIYDNESDPRFCIWKSGKLLPSPNIASHKGKAILALVASLVLALGVVGVIFLVRMGGAPGLADRKRAPPAQGARRLLLGMVS
ncbi:unnamed protein product [Effrenium voratum]|uniref:Uncharacterized protein n=1 Tax=Effrenium voratum TaxID=2562239 RepID=A0AA36J5U1_9DINO|nr:unnamed protein product [Effrenium voratum]